MNAQSYLPEILTASEAIKILRVSRPIFYQLTRRAGFPVIRAGKKYLIPREALFRWLENQHDGPNKQV